MCTSDQAFSLIELLVGLAVSLVLALAVAPLWVGLQTAAGATGDRVILAGQSRVAVARLERDLRSARPGLSEDGGGSAVLRAGPRELVVLVETGGALQVVEWEIVAGALMRRRGPWPPQGGATVTHAWYTDHKTMLEGLDSAAAFTYLSHGRESASVDLPADRADVEVVLLRGALGLPEGAPQGRLDVWVWGRVGR